MTLMDKLRHREHKFETIMAAIKKLSDQTGKEIEILTYIHIVYKPKSPGTQSVLQGQKGFHKAGDLAVLMHNDGLISEEQRDSIVKIVKARIQKEGPYRVWGQLNYPWFKYKDLGYMTPNSCLDFYTSK